MTSFQDWQQRIGSQRDWVWRGWQTRYTYIRCVQLDRTATPLLLLHGFGASIGHWRHNLIELSQEYTVYALDLLGFGASSKPVATYDVALWVEQVCDFYQTFISQPVVLIGNCIGSLVGLAAAAAHPEMVRAIVMINVPDPAVRTEVIPRFIQPLVVTVEKMVASSVVLKTIFPIVRRPQIVRPWASLAYANPDAVTEELVEILVRPALDKGAAQAFCVILQSMISVEFGPSVKAVLPTLSVPILLLWGQQDRMVPISLGRRLAQCSPNLKLVEIENAGHCAHDECPERVNREILDWLTQFFHSASQLDEVQSPGLQGSGE